MKKLIPVFLSVLLSTSAFAYHKPFTGFYGGLELGLTQSKVDNHFNTVLSWPQAFNITLASDAKVTDRALMGGVSVGYTALVQNSWVLGVEGRAHFQKLNTMQDNKIQEINSMLKIDKNTSANLNTDFAVAAKIGFAHHCKFLIYGLVGVDCANIDLSINALYEQNLGSMISGTIENNNQSYESGIMLGLGMEYLITKCSSIALEYNYVDYGALKFKNPISGLLFADGIPQVGAFISEDNSVHMQTSKVFLKFNYYFA